MLGSRIVGVPNYYASVSHFIMLGINYRRVGAEGRAIPVCRVPGYCEACDHEQNAKPTHGESDLDPRGAIREKQ
jgi:hypothetical protein